MRNFPGKVALVLAAALTMTCSGDDLLLEAPATSATLAAARARFQVLDDLVQTSLGFEQVDGWFQPVDPPVGTSSQARRSPVAGGFWSKPGNHRIRAELPARAGGVMRLSNGPVTIEVRPVGSEMPPAPWRAGPWFTGTLTLGPTPSSWPRRKGWRSSSCYGTSKHRGSSSTRSRW